jgi:hypothetical protein
MSNSNLWRNAQNASAIPMLGFAQRAAQRKNASPNDVTVLIAIPKTKECFGGLTLY